MTEALYHDPALAALYDASNGRRERPGGRPDFEFVLDQAAGAGSTLDVGCGTGGLAVLLSERCAATGLDPARAMLDVARARAGGGGVEWILGTAPDLPPGRRWDLIAMTGHAFQCLIEDEEVAETLAACARALAPGGEMVFDSRNPASGYREAWAAAGGFETSLESPGGPVRHRCETEFDAGTGLVTYADEWRFADGAVRRSTARLRSMSRGEIAAALARAGMVAAKTFGDWHGASWQAGSPDIVTVARHA